VTGPGTGRSSSRARPRSDRARVAILDAAWDLLRSRGLRHLTIEAIAGHAGVGKATIYRWWPSKAAVVMDALQGQLDIDIAFPDTGSAREDLRLQIRAVVSLLTTTDAGRAYLALIAESQHDAAVADALATRYIAARRRAAAVVFERGIARGELRADLDPAIAIDALYGAVYYRLLVSHSPPTPGYADDLINQLYPAFALGGSSPGFVIPTAAAGSAHAAGGSAARSGRGTNEVQRATLRIRRRDRGAGRRE
jgi:AcrR family transcriptional regulator